MKTPNLILQAAIAMSFAICHSSPAQGTAFTYQGRLNSGGSPATGLFDLRFTIYDASVAGNDLTGPLVNAATPVSNGLFTVTLDFGAAVFSGSPRWLEIAVRTNGGGAFTTLSPRQKLNATPYAVTAGNVTGIVPSTSLSGTYSNAVTFNNPANSFSGSGAGLTSLNASQLSSGTVPANALGNAWKTSGNAGTTAGAHFIGTTDDQPVELKVNGQRVFRWERPTNAVVFGSVLPNVVGGYESNVVAGGVGGATIAGGGGPAWYGTTPPHTVNAPFGTIGGGVGNVVLAPVAVIAGGERGFIGSNAYNSFLGGGAHNSIGGPDATLGGGRSNTNLSGLSSLGGGWLNVINTTGGFSVLGGGLGNFVDAERATIAGGVANKILTGAFYATIGGGRDNISIGGGSTTIAGGAGNAQTNSLGGTIGGGFNNVVLPGSTAGVIGGGSANTVQGAYATIPGGDQNFAGTNSFAAGHRAKALHTGTFVWADATDADFASTGPNQFFVRAGGGVLFLTGGQRLETHGDVRLGQNGLYFAPAGGENLRIVRGTVSGGGGALQGQGFVVSQSGTGVYAVTFTPAFAGFPTVTVTVESGAALARLAITEAVSASGANIRTFVPTDGTPVNAAFHFIAIGPR